MPWKFFLGACFLTGALLIPHAGPAPVARGMVLAGVTMWAYLRFGRDDTPDQHD